MLLISTELRPSSIEGLGLFALTPIPARSLVWRLDPLYDLVCDREKILALPGPMQEYILRYGYTSTHRPQSFILECDNGRFMNHSDDPNVDFQEYEVARTLRHIAAGEELTCNYRHFDADFDGTFESCPLWVSAPRVGAPSVADTL